MNIKKPSPARPIFLITVIGFSLFALAVCVMMIAFHLSYIERIYPGVRVGWVDLSGLTVEEATAQLASKITYPQEGHILLQDGGNTWVASPSQIGLFMGPEYSARMAFDYGRSGPALGRFSAQFNAWYQGVNLPVEMLFDQRTGGQFLEGIAAQVDVPTIEASLTVDGSDVVVNPGQIGRSVNVAATLDLLEIQMRSLSDGEIPLVVDESPPVILDVTEQAEIARRILSAPLVLAQPNPQEGDPGPWRFEPQELGGMLVIERVHTPEGETYQVGLSQTLMRSFLQSLAPDLTMVEKNARFMFNDDTRQLEMVEHAVIGRALDVETSLQAINDAVVDGEHQISLTLNYTDPAVTDDATAESLGITELVSSHTSYFYGSGTSRKQNIKTAASQFHGLLVAPGEIFSMASVLGDVSLDTGYAEAWIIFGDRTIKGVGGGVCQVSTTLFRTVFLGGYPVVERWPHAYRVYYYEQVYGGGHDAKWAGLDATVYVPVVDFKFRNDSENWLLMETYISDNSLTWKFYSTSDGRTVEWDTSGLSNIEDPPDPLYQENSDLAKGEIEQVDWAVDGADVAVTRNVWRNGEIVLSDSFSTHYVPWRAVCEYGPGTRGMPPETPSKSNPCRPDSNNND